MSFPVKLRAPNDLAEKWEINPQEVASILKQNNALVEVRGQVITAALFIEEKLDIVLSTIFMGKNRQLFKELLLSKEFFTFMNKWKVFRDLTKRGNIAFSDEKQRKKACELLVKAIHIRDRFAHGDIVFVGPRPELHYMYAGEMKSALLDVAYFEEVRTVFRQSAQMLDDVAKFLVEK